MRGWDVPAKPSRTLVPLMLASLMSTACAVTPGNANDPAAVEPGSRERSSISVSPRVVGARGSIEVEINAAEGFTWDAVSILEQRIQGGWKPVARLILLPSRRDHVYEFTSLDARGAVPLAAFGGDYAAEALLPDVDPGRYRLTKTFDSEDGTADPQHATAAFVVERRPSRT